jgi:DTW domain-containing protein YfiP
MQHPNEAKHGKNSARLVPLAISSSEIYIGESAKDFARLREYLASKHATTCVFYPHPRSLEVEQQLAQYQAANYDTLIFIDATWRKAYKMWQLNSWLHDLPSWHFANPPSSQYTIRSTKLNNAISTLESTSYILSLGHGVDTRALLELFQAMQNNQLQHI